MSVSNTAVISARPAAGVRCLVQRAPRGGLRAWMAWANNNRARWQHRVLRSATGCGHLPVLLPVMLASPNRADGGGQVVSTPTAPQLSGMQQASGSLEVSSCLEVGRQEGLVLRSPTSLMVHSKAKILRLLEQGSTNYKPAREMGDAIQGLITQSSEAPPVMRAQELGQGTWEVFYAPHIVNLSKTLLGTRFEPIRYTFKGNRIVSNVQFNGPVIGKGWLSASGTYRALDCKSVHISFDEFWIDVGDEELREEFVERRSVVTGNIFSWAKLLRDKALVDRVVGTVGRAAFFPSVSVFPVLYLDNDLAVFRFEPFSSNIAVHHKTKPEPQGGVYAP